MKKLFYVTGAVLAGLYLFGSWTGRSFHFNVLGQNQLGAAINDAQGVAPASIGQGAGPATAAASLRSPMMAGGSVPVSAVMASSQVLPGRAEVAQVIA